MTRHGYSATNWSWISHLWRFSVIAHFVFALMHCLHEHCHWKNDPFQTLHKWNLSQSPTNRVSVEMDRSNYCSLAWSPSSWASLVPLASPTHKMISWNVYLDGEMRLPLGKAPQDKFYFTQVLRFLHEAILDIFEDLSLGHVVGVRDLCLRLDFSCLLPCNLRYTHILVRMIYK